MTQPAGPLSQAETSQPADARNRPGEERTMTIPLRTTPPSTATTDPLTGGEMEARKDGHSPTQWPEWSRHILSHLSTSAAIALSAVRFAAPGVEHRKAQKHLDYIRNTRARFMCLLDVVSAGG